MENTARHMSIALVALMALLLGSAGSAGAVGDEARGPVISLVSKNVASGQGTVAWSPDGRRLAYIEKALLIRDMESEKQVKSPVRGIYYIRWIDDSQIMALRRQKDMTLACLLDASGELIAEAVLPVRADAAYELKGFQRLLIVSTTMDTLRIGVQTVSTVSVFNTPDGSYGNTYTTSRIHPRVLADRDFIMGWSEAGPSPLDDTLVLIDYKDPPALNPYVRAIAVDYSTGKGSAFYRLSMGMLSSGAGWAPDGRSIALADGQGSLRIIGRNGETQVPETDIKGTYAAWSPVADRICFGGYIMGLKGGNVLKLRDGAEGARCFWRPGGRDLALLTDRRLELFSGADEPGPDKGGDRAGESEKASEILKKVRLLRELLEEGHLDVKDYNMRLRRLTGIETVEESR